MRLVDADEAEKYLYEHLDDLHMIAAQNAIDEMPTIDAQPVKHGTWITTQKTIDDGITTCSYCHREFYIDDLVPVGNEDGFCEFCPACGSDNRGDAE